MTPEHRYYGYYNNRWMIGIFLYTYQTGSGVFDEDQVILFDESSGESTWIELGYFLNHFSKLHALDLFMLQGYNPKYDKS